MSRLFDLPEGGRAHPVAAHRTRRWLLVARVAGAAALIGAGPGVGPLVAGTAAAGAVPDAVSVFATAPAPGHPFGIAVDDDRIYVSTSAGDFFAGHLNS